METIYKLTVITSGEPFIVDEVDEVLAVLRDEGCKPLRVRPYCTPGEIQVFSERKPTPRARQDLKSYGDVTVEEAFV